MELKGEFELSTDRHTVSSFASDIDKVVTLIPDVQSSERVSDTSARLTVKLSQGAIKGKFKLLVEITGKGNDEKVGISAKGSGTTGSLDLKAIFEFFDLGANSTKVKWVVTISIGGLIAAMGARVINNTAEKYVTVLTDSFMKTFEK